jgi:hypothetical protein
MAKVDHYIITYDVYNDARRKALHWRLRKWAVPSPGAAGKQGQRSVMEAALTTKEKGQVIETASEILAPGDVFKMFKQQRPGPIIILGSAKKVKFAALTKHKPKKNRGSRRNAGEKWALVQRDGMDDRVIKVFNSRAAAQREWDKKYDTGMFGPKVRVVDVSPGAATELITVRGRKTTRPRWNNHRRNASGQFTILAKSESDAKRRFRTAYPNRLVKSVTYDGFGKGGYQKYTIYSLWRDDVEAAPRKNRRRNRRNRRR